jgi:hypothetical protein
MCHLPNLNRPLPANRGDSRPHRFRAALALVIATLLLTISFWLPFWQMTFFTGQHPQGVRVSCYLNDFPGPFYTALPLAPRRNADLRGSLVKLGRSLTVALVSVACLLLAAVGFIHNRWAALVTIPAVGFPLIVVGDTTRCVLEFLATYSTNADPLRASPAFLFCDRLAVGGIALEGRPGAGLIVAATASLAVLAGLWFHLKSTPIR